MGFDLFPTFLDMAGIQYDDSQKPLDGVSIRPLLQGVTIAPRNDGGGARRRIARRGDPSFYVSYVSGGSHLL